MADLQRNTNGWTRYENLVLSTLERHEELIADVQKDILEMRIINSEVSLKLLAVGNDLKELCETIKESIKDVKEAKKEAVEQKHNLQLLNFKFGMLATVLGLISGGIGQLVIKPLSSVLAKIFGG